MFQARGDSQALLALSLLAVLLVLIAYHESVRRSVRHMLPGAVVFLGAVLAHALSGIHMSLYSWFAILLAVVSENAVRLLSSGEGGVTDRLFAPMTLAMSALPLLFSTGAVASGGRSFGVALVGGFAAGAVVRLSGACSRG